MIQQFEWIRVSYYLYPGGEKCFTNFDSMYSIDQKTYLTFVPCDSQRISIVKWYFQSLFIRLLSEFVSVH